MNISASEQQIQLNSIQFYFYSAFNIVTKQLYQNI